eukprot:5648469-Pleurochrysis_carterae.AAC.1
MTSRNGKNNRGDKGLVKKSARLSALRTNGTASSSSSTFSRMKNDVDGYVSNANGARGCTPDRWPTYCRGAAAWLLRRVLRARATMREGGGCYDFSLAGGQGDCWLLLAAPSYGSLA